MNVIVAGDFNTAPKGGLYEFMRNGFYDCLKNPRKNISC
jgi:hypothetical protein